MSGSHQGEIKKTIAGEHNYELLELVNVLLVASYQFLFLNSVSKNLTMAATNWYARKNDEKCRDSAVMILSWIKETGGYIQLADLAQPRYEESDLAAEFVMQRWDEVEKWVQSKIEQIKSKLEENFCQDREEIINILNSVSACLTSKKNNLLFYDYGCY